MAPSFQSSHGTLDVGFDVVSNHLVVATADGLTFADGHSELVGSDVIDVAVDAAGRIAALVGGSDINLGGGGHGWKHIASIGDGENRVLTWHGDDLLVGGADAQLWRVAIDGATHRVDGFSNAPTSADWHTPWGGPPDVYSMTSDGTDAYVNVHVGGILRSDDLLKWTPTIDLHLDVHDVSIDGDGTLWAATGMRGLARSSDRGATWTHFTDGLHATYARAVAALRGCVLVSVSSGPFADDGAVYRLDGHSLTRLNLPHFEGTISRGRLVGEGDVAAIALPDGTVVTTTDHGNTWHTAMSGHQEVRVLAFRPSHEP